MYSQRFLCGIMRRIGGLAGQGTRVMNLRSRSAFAQPDSILRHPATLLVPLKAFSFVSLHYFTKTMKFLLVPCLVLVTAPVAVSACEGECIVGITNAFLGNYSNPIQTVLDDIVSHTVILSI
jgi:hypothetical protein